MSNTYLLKKHLQYSPVTVQSLLPVMVMLFLLSRVVKVFKLQKHTIHSPPHAHTHPPPSLRLTHAEKAIMVAGEILFTGMTDWMQVGRGKTTVRFLGGAPPPTSSTPWRFVGFFGTSPGGLKSPPGNLSALTSTRPSLRSDPRRTRRSSRTSSSPPASRR